VPGSSQIALTHPGDNTRDQSAAGNDINLLERPRHVMRVLDYITREWIWRDHADSTRVGIFGASLGAFTAVVAAGGTPDMARVARIARARVMLRSAALCASVTGINSLHAAGPR